MRDDESPETPPEDSATTSEPEESADAPRRPEPAAEPEPAREHSESGQSRSLLIGGVIAVFALGAIVISIASSAPAPTPASGNRANPGNKAATTLPFEVGKPTAVVLTLKPQDKGDLYCASKLEVAGKRCAFESSSVPRAKAEDEPTTLIPFTTTDRKQILAAGLWDDPALAADKLPSKRFNIACTFNVEGKLASPEIKWGKAKWRQTKDDWYAGTLTNCKLK